MRAAELTRDLQVLLTRIFVILYWCCVTGPAVHQPDQQPGVAGRGHPGVLGLPRPASQGSITLTSMAGSVNLPTLLHTWDLAEDDCVTVPQSGVHHDGVLELGPAGPRLLPYPAADHSRQCRGIILPAQ